MKNLFITEDDIFEVKIYVAEDEEGLIYCDITEEGVNILLEDKDLSIEEYKVVFRKPSFGDLKTLTDILTAPRETEMGITYDMNPIATRIQTISFFIKDWNLVDSKGEKVPTTEENIMKLNPIIAAAIGIQLDFNLSSKEVDSVEEPSPPVPPTIEEISETDVSVVKV